jgi:subtilisin family serine protease
MSSSRRGIAVVVALVALATGAGLPAADSCAMHHHAAGDVQLSPPSHDAGCHTGAAETACATTGVCPSTGAAAPAAQLATIGAAALHQGAVVAVDAAFHSHTAPPLSPPPQA